MRQTTKRDRLIERLGPSTYYSLIAPLLEPARVNETAKKLTELSGIPVGDSWLSREVSKLKEEFETVTGGRE